MKYVSLDLETSDTLRHENNVLSLAMVIDDLEDQRPLGELPALKLIFRQAPHSVSDVATAMNSHIYAARALFSGEKPESLKKLFKAEDLEKAEKLVAEYEPVSGWIDVFGMTQNHAVRKVLDFLAYNGLTKGINLAGKNVANFDFQFLPESLRNIFNYGMLDPGSMYFQVGDKRVPSTAECCRRAGIVDSVTHDAYEDALQVIELIRRSPQRRTSK